MEPTVQRLSFSPTFSASVDMKIEENRHNSLGAGAESGRTAGNGC